MAPASPPDFFAVFDLPRRFGVDRAELERRFYRLSRELHPDRFATAGADERRTALEKMSLVNEAYGTLKDSDRLREYFLRLAGVLADAATSGIPMELAESWFELQEALLEDPASAAGRITEFKSELRELQNSNARELGDMERELDSRLAETSDLARVRPDFEKLAAKVRERSYLASLERDVERMHG